jgi:hypothetical protein
MADLLDPDLVGLETKLNSVFASSNPKVPNKLTAQGLHTRDVGPFPEPLEHRNHPNANDPGQPLKFTGDTRIELHLAHDQMMTFFVMRSRDAASV